MKKVGIFGGSFDPVHLGHLNLAISLKEQASLDHVLFIPTLCSPFKQAQPPRASVADRLEMLYRAVSMLEGFSIWEGELLRPAPSYMIDTVRQLRQEREEELHLLFAQDVASSFLSWKESELLLRWAPPLVAQNGTQSVDCPWAQSYVIPHLEISSTRIRERIKQGLFCGHLLAQPVWDYIQSQGFYR